MSISVEIRFQVRQLADFSCEYCGISETGAGGELTIDHYQPQSKGGSDAVENLLYCCTRCNQYKADYWPAQASDPILWNPHESPGNTHWLVRADGHLHPLTVIGQFTLKRLRLNRPALVAYRLRQRQRAEELRLLNRYHEILNLLEHLQQQQRTLLEEQRLLLEEQRILIKLLLGR